MQLSTTQNHGFHAATVSVWSESRETQSSWCCARCGIHISQLRCEDCPSSSATASYTTIPPTLVKMSLSYQITGRLSFGPVLLTRTWPSRPRPRPRTWVLTSRTSSRTVHCFCNYNGVARISCKGAQKLRKNNLRVAHKTTIIFM